jgi:hypothetical protein
LTVHQPSGGTCGPGSIGTTSWASLGSSSVTFPSPSADPIAPPGTLRGL